MPHSKFSTTVTLHKFPIFGLFVHKIYFHFTGSDSTTESNNHLENEALVSDGNQNNQQSPDEVILSKSNSSNNEESNNELNNKSLIKTTINQLKEICEDLCSQVVSMKSEEDVKDKACADDIKSDVEDEDDDEDEDDNNDNGDNKCNKTDKDESRENSLLLSELQSSRRIIAELETKLNAFIASDTKKATVQTDTDELVLLNAFNDSCETLHHASVESLNIRKSADSSTQTDQEKTVVQQKDSSVSDESEINDQPTHIDSDKSQLDHTIPDKNLDVGSDSVADDMKMLCDPNIEREEQLIAFKEHCAELTESNLLLKNQLNEIQMKLSNGHSMISNRYAIAAIAIVIICWLILPYL